MEKLSEVLLRNAPQKKIKMIAPVEIIEMTEPQANAYTLKRKIASTDYKVIKCAEYQLAGLPAPYDIVALNVERQAIRDEINIMEG